MKRKPPKLKRIVSNKMLCDLPDLDKILGNRQMLKDYLNEGWEAITKNYKSGEVSSPGKERSINKKNQKKHFDTLEPAEKTLALEFLGSIRKYTVQSYFDCAKAAVKTRTGNLNEYFAAGSTNITSDYDVAVTGPDANEIMWIMFKKFVKKFKSSLPHSFDSNLYSSPLYIHTAENGTKIEPLRLSGPLFPRVNYGSRNFTLVPHNKVHVNEELAWAGIKLLPIFEKYINGKHAKLQEILSNSIQLKTELDLECQSAEGKYPELQDFLRHGNYDEETKHIIKNYFLQYTSQKVCQDFVYKSLPLKGKQNFFYHSNKANYFSSEAYYTSSAVNSIVVENQLGHKLDFGTRSFDVKRKIYLTAAIENLGDMVNHMTHEKGSNLKKTIVKYSKYLYRIYFCLGKAGDQQDADKADKIKKDIIPFRKTYNTKIMDKLNSWKIIGFDPQTDSLKTYLDKIIKKVLKNIEDKLNQKHTSLKRPATAMGRIRTQKNKSTFGGRKTLKKKKRRRKRNRRKRK